MKLINYKGLRAMHPHVGVAIIQRLGYDEQGRRLKIDGIEGPLTRGAIYVDPTSVEDPIVLAAMGELLLGAQEHGGNNRGPRVEAYQRGRSDELEGWMRGAWCASFASWCLMSAHGEDTPYIRGARRLGAEVARRSPMGKLRAHELEEGDLIIWDRDGPDEGTDPSDDWHGHVGVVVGRAGGYLWTIEGNAAAKRGAVRVYRFPEDDLDRGPGGPFLFGARWHGG